MSSPSSSRTLEQNTTRQAISPAVPLRTPDSMTKGSPKALGHMHNASPVATGEPLALRRRVGPQGVPSIGSIFKPREARKRELDSSDGNHPFPAFKVKVVEQRKEYNQSVACHSYGCHNIRSENERLERRNVELRDMLDQQDEDIVRCKMKLRRAEDSVIEKERAMESLLEENAALLERVSLLEEMLSGPSPDRQHSYSPASGFVGDHWDGKLISGKKISIGDHDVIPRYFLDASVPSKVISAVDVSDVFGEPREVVLKVFDHVEEVQFMNDCGVMTKFGKTGMVPQLVATYKTDSNFVAILNNYQANLLNVPVTLCGNVRFAQQVMQKLLEKVDCLHSNGYTNFRISPKGIVFSDDGEVSLGDSTQCCPIVHAKKGGIECRGGFSAPELLAGKGLSRPRAADVWSVGAVLAWLLGKPINGPINDYKSASAAADRVFTRLRDPDGRDFLEKLLCPFPSRRITAKNALEHRWLTGTPLEPMNCDWIHKVVVNRSLSDQSFSFQFPPGPVIPLALDD